MDPTKQTKVELSFRAEKLVGGDLDSKADPKCYLWMREETRNELIREEKKLMGTTEMVNNSHNPEWSTKITLKYFENKTQHLTFEVKDVDRWSEKLIGTCYTTLDSIVKAKDNTLPLGLERTVWYYPLLSNTQKCKQKKTGTLVLSGEVYEADVFYMNTEGMTPEEQYREIQKVDVSTFKKMVNYVHFNPYGIKLKRMDFLGKSDPFYCLYRPRRTNPDEWQKFFTSEVIKETLKPNWVKQKFSYKDFCQSDPHQKVKIEVYDWNSTQEDQLIGYEYFSVQDSVDAGPEFSLQLKFKKKKKGRGIVRFHEFLVAAEEEYNQEMLDQWKAYKINIMDTVVKKQVQFEQDQYWATFMKLLGRHEMKMMVAIDCTGGRLNLPITNPDCPHFMGSPDIPHLNDFQRSLKEVTEIVLSFNKADQGIPFYGFGGYPTNNVEHSDFFAFNGDIYSPDVRGIEELLNTYNESLSKMKLGEHRRLSPMLRRLREKVYEESLFNENRYFVLMIVVNDDYQCSDPGEVINTFNDLPLSIIIVGAGDATFQKMRELDELNENRGQGNRDICQFVKFGECGEGTLAKNVLKELPQQVVEYNRMKHGKRFTKEEVDWMVDERTVNYVQKIQQLDDKNSILEERLANLEKMVLENKQ